MADIKQWVNLDPDTNHRTAAGVTETLNEPKVRCGTALKLRAKVKGSGNKAGRRVFWGVQTDPGNVFQLAAGTGPTGRDSNKWAWQPHQGGFGAPGFYERLQPTNKSGESNITFHLSASGGDKFTVKAYTKKPDGSVKDELKSETYIVWRQLFYQVTNMGPSVGNRNLPAIPNVNWTNVKNEFNDSRKPHNIRWTEVAPAVNPVTRHRSLIDDAMKIAAMREGYQDTYEPLLLKVSLVDLLGGVASARHTFQVTSGSPSYTAQLPHLLYDQNSADDKDDWFPPLAGGTDPFTANRSDNNAPINLTRASFSKASDSSVTVTMQVPRGFWDWCLGRQAVADVSVTYRHFQGMPNGMSWYNGIWAIHQEREWDASGAQFLQDRTMTDKVGTMIHELGHAIGMSRPGGPYHYPTSHGHTGNHCWFGATDPSTLASASTRFPSSPRAQCVMFGDSSRQKHVFCDTCSGDVRTRDPGSNGKFSQNMVNLRKRPRPNGLGF